MKLVKDGIYVSLIALGVALAVLLAVLAATATVERAQIAASDFVFLSENGPRLGRRSRTGEIVLVLFDDRSARQMGGLPTYEQDLALYSALFDAGAKIVADTRMIAMAEESADVRQLLDGMAASGAPGRLFRDVWTPAAWPAETIGKYRPYIAHHLLNMHPNADAFLDARLYPLFSMAADGMYESLPLALARSALDWEPTTSANVLEQAKQHGITAAWQSQLPENMRPNADLAGEDVARTPYSFGDRQIRWREFSSNAPLIPPAGYWISYASPPSELERISYVDASKGASRDRVKGKIVLVGYAAKIDPTSDTYDVPYSSTRAASAEIVAAALDTLLVPNVIRPVPVWEVWSATLVLAWAMALAGGILRPLASAGVVAALLAVFLGLSVVGYRAGWQVDLVLAPMAGLVAGGLGAGYRYLREVRWRLRIVDLFGRYVPRAVVTQLVNQPGAEALALGGIKKEVTVLFADIRGFTSFAERCPPEEVLEQLNSLLKIMVDCTFAHEGTVDKFIGDAILVLFNAPLDQTDHTLRAARTAWAIQEGLHDHPSGLAIGIGIHRGEAVVGRVGTPERMEYTAIGSTVNVTSRLCSAAQRGQIVVSDVAAEELDGEFELEQQPPIRVKGVDRELATCLLLRPIVTGGPKGGMS